MADYGLDTYTFDFDAPTLAGLVDGDQYTLCVSPGRMDMRACQVLIAETETTGDAFQPLAVTFNGGRNGGAKRDAVRPNGRA